MDTEPIFTTSRGLLSFGYSVVVSSPPDNFEYADVLPKGLAHRRGAGINPGNRFEATKLHVLGEEIDRRLLEAETDEPRRVPVELFPDRTQTIINQVSPTSDVPFNWTLNPYRGCEHGCIYCFARPFHEYLGFSSGLDFETKLTVKHDAPALLEKELASERWKPEPIVMSAITDIYQPIEAKLKLARRCLEVLERARQPVSTMTKGALVLRDLDLWQSLGARNAGRVTMTIVTLDDTLAKQLEPRAASPARRLAVLRELVKAGVPTSVNIAPIIPGLTDHEVPKLLEAIADTGCQHVSWVLLRLPYQLKAIFEDWLARNVHPERAKHVLSLLTQIYDGKLYKSELRWDGKGKIAEGIAQTIAVFKMRYHLTGQLPRLTGEHFRRPMRGGQMAMFD